MTGSPASLVLSFIGDLHLLFELRAWHYVVLPGVRVKSFATVAKIHARGKRDDWMEFDILGP
jgi:hypothetical protein